jgi:hypothetical protein
LRSVAFYGPDDRRASKVVVGIVSGIISFIDHFGAKSVIAHERILPGRSPLTTHAAGVGRERWRLTMASLVWCDAANRSPSATCSMPGESRGCH